MASKGPLDQLPWPDIEGEFKVGGRPTAAILKALDEGRLQAHPDEHARLTAETLLSYEDRLCRLESMAFGEASSEVK